MTHRAQAVREAIVLAAGNGDRFVNGSQQSKLLASVAGVPLLLRTLTSASRAGITQVHVVLGYDADRVRSLAQRAAGSNFTLRFHLNPDWRLENGVSVLAARPGLSDEPFALMMGDHIFDWRVLGMLLRTPLGAGEALLGIDHHIGSGCAVDEATKVRLDGDRVIAVGKTLDRYDALDTGLFVCQSSVFDALEMSCGAGDTTLSGGVRGLAARGLVRGVDIGDAVWCDVDTIDDLVTAEELFAHRAAI